MDPSNSPPPPVANLEFKTRLMLVLLVVLVLGSAAYILIARGAFERTQQLILIADDSEGIAVGMDLTFSGFPIGRVGRIELSPQGHARFVIDVPVKDAHWLRTSSIFTMESGLIGGTRLRAFTGMLSDPLLPDGSERRLLQGDAKAEIPLMVASVRELIGNLRELTNPHAPLDTSLRNVQTATDRFNGPGGALERTTTLLAHLDTLTLNANKQVFGPQGVMVDAQASVVQLHSLLADAHNSLTKVDAVLKEAQAIGANTREATTDLGALRAELENSLRKVDQLVNEVNRKWPFQRETEVKLP